jgi:transposase
MRERKIYPKEFKEGAVDMVVNGGRTAQSAARELGVCVENVRRWVRETKKGKDENIKVFPGQGNPRDEELFRLRKRVADLEESNEILKKAMAIFAVRTPR